jgi:hypothetical protein
VVSRRSKKSICCALLRPGVSEEIDERDRRRHVWHGRIHGWRQGRRHHGRAQKFIMGVQNKKNTKISRKIVKGEGSNSRRTNVRAPL